VGRRRTARELALKLLYQLELAPAGATAAETQRFWEDHPAEVDVKEFASQLVETVVGRREELDKIIESAVENWQLGRIAPLERSLLRMAIAEMLFIEAIPPKASLDEAIEIAKVYGSTARSYQFVNGVLDNVYRRYGREKP